ncbi:hypothetical protein BZF52_23350, partial [Salmonella enterica subsp. enterica serovar Derby]|nr:hypothetical protein [Salmonella enterica subsp. enterica serovar Derby]
TPNRQDGESSVRHCYRGLHIPATWSVCLSKSQRYPFNVTRPLTTHVPDAVLQPNMVAPTGLEPVTVRL